MKPSENHKGCIIIGVILGSGAERREFVIEMPKVLPDKIINAAGQTLSKNIHE